jgi:hypothetical protein
LLKGAHAREPAKTTSAPEDEKDLLNEELQKFDEIPSLGGKYKTPEEAKTAKIQHTESSKPNAETGDVDLLKAELSDFMDKLETKKKKPAVQKDNEANKRVQDEPKRTQPKNASEK